ncbi:hypothetical protein Kpol_526p33 [Vanderwaltozyma polyspora DSM 70294]|uniref:UNC-45/Cro1/She4 central domain-containing protein n=1 Tax=Vanderwaltozyma polyspora (strain ATCC 22028 / DSM 70294 / BCRC 21397 / CBS 2163 / NBRC 10782 / NRRL Y-8283 / UCD 57-17) TaxID=436907 RepID=A7TLT8_VANPO|nr:uncharacterized protein Kpol_526p33 [Vanderwaltozyma polyspora DSM 70294]EDO16780.1 hypothetical protein Kpol_526p33 [Vanderwaltozyma polyspora DSM 70294]
MNEEEHHQAVNELCESLSKDLKVNVDAKDYVNALDEIFRFSDPGNESGLISGTSNSSIEEALNRCYLDHSETKEYLLKLINEDIRRAIELFEVLSTQSVHILVGCFENSEASKPLLQELQQRIYFGEDLHVKYLLSVILQLLTKFEYDFNDVSFLVKDLGVRMRESDVKSLALIIFIKLESLYSQRFDEKFLNFIDCLIIEVDADVGNDPLSIIVEVLTELYPALTALCSQVFLGKKLDEMFRTRVVEQNDAQFSKTLLHLLSVACIDETVRNHISENYTSMLEQSLNFEEYKTYSALVLIKTWSFTKLHNVSINQLGGILTESIEKYNEDNGDHVEIGASLEGLAYLSLKTSVKLQLRKNSKFCLNLISLIKNEEKSAQLYGALVIFANLSVFPQDSNSNGNFESKSLRDLKAYSDLKSPGGDEVDNGIESKEDVIEFNDEYLINNELLSYLRTDFSQMSHGSRQQFIRIIYNITRNKDSISECIKQGCTTSVLEYLVEKTETGDMVRILGLRALTRMLIYTNPSLIFNKYSPVNAIPFLFELLPKYGDEAEAEPCYFNEDLLTTTDCYEALLALTNLASSTASDGDDVCKRITTNTKYWTVIENLILDENVLIQRSTLELISNMMSHPMQIAVKFFNFENPQSLRNFNILVKLLQLNDVESQRAVAAIFANVATTLPFVAHELLSQKELIEKSVQVFTEQNDDIELKKRLVILFYSLFDSIPAGEENKYPILTENKKFELSLEAALDSDIKNDEDFAEVIPQMLSRCSAN